MKATKVWTRTARERLVIKTVQDAHAWLGKRYDNKWGLYAGDLPAGTYAYVGGKWVNVKTLDLSVLAHV